MIFLLFISFNFVRITTDSPANEGGRLGLEGQAWSVTGAAFAQAKGVTAEARRVESRCYAAGESVEFLAFSVSLTQF
jgi:hypothetical protein